MSTDTAATPVARKPRVKLALLAGIIIAVLGAGTRFAARDGEQHDLVQWTNAQEIPSVEVIHPSVSRGEAGLELPGQLEAWTASPIHARVDGYLKSWTVDIGASVKAGQRLATIDTPELDQQLAQAKADLAKVQSQADLAEVTATRWHHLLASNSVSKQESDEKEGELQAAHAAVDAAKANADRLAALETFKFVVAPFDGTVTSRNTDVGDLIAAGDGANSTLFSVADTTHMRLYVHVPQNDASVIKPGMQVNLTVPERPDETYHATLVGNSGAVNSASGSMLVQFQVDNRDNGLFPGDYASVELPQQVASATYTLPATTLLFRDAGPQVAVFGADGKAHLRNIHIAQDEGASLQIDRGLEPGDQVIDHPPDSLADGDAVQLATISPASNSKAKA